MVVDSAQAEPQSGSRARSGNLPDSLRAEFFANLHAEFLTEFVPVGPTERTLVRILVSHATRQAFAGDATAAVSREAIRRLLVTNVAVPELMAGSDDDSHLALAAAATSVQTWDRSSLMHSREFARTLSLLQTIQAERRKLGPCPPPSQFQDDAECETFLAARVTAGEVACPRCGQRGGYYLAARRAWECQSCHAQHGLRVGTVMQGSQLTLSVWFEAIRQLLWNPQLTARELGDRIQVRREKTLRHLAARICAALTTDNSSQPLAGLDRHFGRPVGDRNQAPGHLNRRLPRAEKTLEGGADPKN